MREQMRAAFPLQYSRGLAPEAVARRVWAVEGADNPPTVVGPALPLRDPRMASAVDILQPGGIGYAGLHKLEQVKRERSLQQQQLQLQREAGQVLHQGGSGAAVGGDSSNDISDLALRIAARLPPTTRQGTGVAAGAEPKGMGTAASLSSKRMVALQVSHKTVQRVSNRFRTERGGSIIA